MAYKVYIDNNYFVVEDTSNSDRIDMSEPKSTVRAYVQDGELKIGLTSKPNFHREYDFSDLIDSGDSPFASVSALQTFIRENTGFNPASGGSGAWGSITGTITNQTDLVNYVAANSGGSFEYQTEITANTTLDGTQKGLNKVYPVNNTAARTITITTGDYVENDVINIERRGQGSVEIIADTGVRIRGVRDIENRYFINDVNSMVSIICRGSEEFVIIGNLTRGYTGAVETTGYDILTEGDTGVDIDVTGSGFSDNMLVTVSANATLNSFTVNSPTSLTLNLDAVGSATDTVTVTYDNGDVFVDTDAITIASSVVSLYSTNPFEYGWGIFMLNSLTPYGVQVRRSSDNAVTNVAFNGSGKIALDSLVSAGGTLTAWAGSDDVFITTFYNQGSVSGFDLIQSTTTEQAKLLNAGALITQDTRPFIQLDGTDDAYQTTDTGAWANNDLSIFYGVRASTINGQFMMGYFPASGAATSRALFAQLNVAPEARTLFCNEAGTATTSVGGAIAVDTNYNISAFSNSTNTRTYINGVAGTAAAALANNPTESIPIGLGGNIANSNAYHTGFMDYAVIYTSNEESNESTIRTIIESFQ